MTTITYGIGLLIFVFAMLTGLLSSALLFLLVVFLPGLLVLAKSK